MRSVVGGNGDHQREPVRIAGLSKQLLGLFHVRGIVIGQLGHEVFAKSGIDAAAQRRAAAVREEEHDLLAVDGIAQRLPHPNVAERLDGVVQIHRLHQIHRALEDGEIAAQLIGLHLCQMRAEIHSARLKRHDNRRGVVKNAKFHLFQLRLLAPVLVEALDDEVLLRRAGNEAEGARANRRGGLPVVIRGDDGRRKSGQKCGVALRQRDDDGFLVRRLDALHSLETVHQCRPVLSLAHAALERIQNIPDRHQLAVMEPDTLAQLEREDICFLGNDVFLGDSGEQIAFTVGLDKPFKYVEQNFPGSCGLHVVRVKTVIQILRNGDDNAVLAGIGCGRAGNRTFVAFCAAGLAVSACAEYRCQAHNSRQEGKNLPNSFHVIFSLPWLLTAESRRAAS